MPPNPIPALKRQLADEILSIIGRLNVTVAAMVLGIDASRLADIRHGRIERFSVERLIRLLATLNRTVSLTVSTGGEREIELLRLLPWRNTIQTRRVARGALGGPPREPRGS